MIIKLEHPVLPKGMSMTIEGYQEHESDKDTLARMEDAIRAARQHRGGLLGILRKAISPDVIQSMTDKVTDAAIAGIASEAKKV
jgi:hypothetical protein